MKRVVVYIFILAFATACGEGFQPSHSERELFEELSHSNTAKPFALNAVDLFPKSATLFSPRFAGNAQTKIDIAKNFNANSIVWHYPNVAGNDDFSLVQLGKEQGLSYFNCAIPSITRLKQNACQNSSGDALGAFPGVYYPNTDTEGFRSEVKRFLQGAAANNCTSLQQDDALMMYARRSNGCMSNLSESQVLQKVRNYYIWLDEEIQNTFGRQMPKTLNLRFREKSELTSYDEAYMSIAEEFFDGTMSEVAKEENHPYYLYKTLDFRNQELNFSTITTLVDKSPLYNRRHISTVYALGACRSHPTMSTYLMTLATMDSHLSMPTYLDL